MSREKQRGMVMEGLIMPTKIRKRVCSSSSSSSSKIRNYRLNKRAGKTRAGFLIGIGSSRSSTPVPTWRATPLRSTVESPKYSQSGRSTQPVSARRLAATLWEMNGMPLPSPRISESNTEQKKSGSKMVFKREKMQSGWRLHSGSSYLPPHLSDPSHSPTVSERIDRSGTGSRQTARSISQRIKSAEQNATVFDSMSNASLVEMETRSHVPTSSGSVHSGRKRLKDVSNALTTSKELLKIMNRLWSRADQPSSSMSVISALHAELERARIQVNHLIKEPHTDKSDIDYLMKRWAEEKASCKIKEQQAVEEAIESVAGELEVERKLRRRLERLNKKLGEELAELKSSYVRVVKDLESEKRAREITEQVCGELARNIDDDRNEVEKLKPEPVEVHEAAEKERGTVELTDTLHEERAWMKPSDGKHHSEEKNTAISKLRKQLEIFLGTKRDKDEKRATHISKSNFIIPERNGQADDREDESVLENKDDSAGSDIQSIQSNVKSNSKSHRWAYANVAGNESMKLPGDAKARNSISGHVSRRSTSMINGVEVANRERLIELEALKRMGLSNRISSSYQLSSTRDVLSPSRQSDQPWPSRSPLTASSKSRLGEVNGEVQTVQRSSKR